MAGGAYLHGPAFVAPAIPDWQALADAMARDELPATTGGRLPRPELLAAGDRRRAPASVALALEAGRMALAAGGHTGAALPGVFTSAHGDLAIVDALCSTLATTPLEVSPTRFLNSIHNAPAGLWSMATASRQATTAVTAGRYSFATGLLEALLQCAADDQAVLFIAYETVAPERLRRTVGGRVPCAFAMIVSSQDAPAPVASFSWSLDNRGAACHEPRTAPGRSLADTGMDNGMAFIETLALREPGVCPLPLSGGQVLRLELAAGDAHTVAPPPSGPTGSQ